MENYVKEVLDEVVVYKPKNKKRRLGQMNDSGYVIVDGYHYDFYISGGIADAVSFDNDFNFLHPNTPGVCIDGSCDRPQNLTKKYDYIPKFIGIDRKSTNKSENFTLLHEYSKSFENIFIKLDIEGHEWNWINNFDNFENVKQMVIECHGLFDLRTGIEGWQNIGGYEHAEIKKALEKINQTHKLVHVHGNNGGGSYDIENNVILESVLNPKHLPVVLELTYIRTKDCEIDGLNDTPFPNYLLDFSNYHNMDFILDYYPFMSIKKNEFFNEYFDKKLYNQNTKLCEIMNTEGSDKGSGHHNYTTFYNYLFSRHQNDFKNIFELGLGTNNPLYPCHMSGKGVPCSSLRGWRSFFINSEVFGADIDKDILYQEERMKTFYCDQLNTVSISDMWSLLPQEFDLIIEDGLHTFEANKTFFLNSHYKLKKGGYFIIEDVHYNDFEKFEELIDSVKQNFEYIELVKIPNPKNMSDNNLVVVKK